MMTWTIDDDRTFTDSEDAAAYIMLFVDEIMNGYDKGMFIMETAYTLDRMSVGKEIKIEGLRIVSRAA